MDLNHIHLHVASVERAASFYERCFGLKRHLWHGDTLFMRDQAGMDLALAPGGAAAMPDWFHIGFRLGAEDEVRRLFDHVLAEGADVRAPLSVEPDFAFFRYADPDGYLIEVYWEPQPA